jgi:hypothetical protein
MLWPGIKKLGKDLRFKRTNSEVVGNLKNCFIKIFDGNNMKVLEIFSPEIDDVDKEWIENILKQNKIKKHDWLNNGIRIIFSEYIRPYSIEKIKSILLNIVEYFNQKYPDNIPQCHNCGIHKNADVYYIGNISKYVCFDCLKILENDANNKYLEYKHLPTNYLSGFFGALIFAIPGIIITTIFFVFLERLVAVSALIYIVLGIKGYKVFKGKITPFGAFIVIIVGIIMIGIGILVAYSILIFRELKTVEFDILIQILKMPEVANEIRMNIILSYVISSIFIFFQLFQMMKEWKFLANIKKAKEI